VQLQVDLLIEVTVGRNISKYASVCPAVAGVLRPGIGSLHNVNLAIAEVAYHVDHPPTGFRGSHIEPVGKTRSSRTITIVTSTVLSMFIYVHLCLSMFIYSTREKPTLPRR